MVKFKGSTILIVLPLLLLIIVFYIPLTTILIRGINFNFFCDIVSSFYYRKVISFTIYQAFLSALLSVIIAIPGSYILTRYNFKGKSVFVSLSSLPFLLPSILTVLGFVLLFGNKGYINRFLMFIFNLENPPLKVLYSLKAVLLAHIFYNFPLAIRIISGKWKKIPYELSEASYTLGSGRIRTFFKVTIHYLSTAIITSFTLIFLYCFMSFGIILVLGGGPSLSTIEVEVYRFARISLDISKAASLSLIESLFTILILIIYFKSEGREYNFPSGREFIKKVSVKAGAFFTLYFIPLTIVLIAPLITIVLSSFLRKQGYTNNYSISLHWYKSIFGGMTGKFSLTAVTAIRNSMLLAMGALIGTIPLALSVSYNLNRKFQLKNLYSIMFFLPTGISSIIIGLSYMNLEVSASHILIVVAHSFIALPLAIRSINNVYKTVDNSLIEASQTLGVNRFYTFLRVELPLLKNGIITAAVFTFALSIGEMNASIMLAPAGFTTIPLAIYQLIGSYNFYGACALGTLLLVVSLFSFRIIDNLEK